MRGDGKLKREINNDSTPVDFAGENINNVEVECLYLKRLSTEHVWLGHSSPSAWCMTDGKSL